MKNILILILLIASGYQLSAQDDRLKKETYLNYMFNILYGENAKGLLIENHEETFHMYTFPNDELLEERAMKRKAEYTFCKDCPVFFQTITKEPVKLYLDSVQSKDIVFIKAVEDGIEFRIYRDPDRILEEED